MSQILRNIINRHQSGGVGLEASQIVQPRQRSRFESAGSSGEIIAQHEIEIEPATSSASEQTSSSSPRSAHQRTDTAKSSSNAAPQTDVVNESVRLSSPSLDQLAEQTPSITTENKGSQHAKDQVVLNQVSEQSRGRDLSTRTGLRPRIRTVLQRLDKQQLKTDNQQSTGAMQAETAALNTSMGFDTGSAAESKESVVSPEQNQILAHNGSEKSSTEIRGDQGYADQSGLLQIPDWLTAMQIDLSNRWQQIKSLSAPESVVNVTIGRVEVKAVNSDSLKQAKAKTKPRGIMSLGEYLQRRNEERA